MRQHVSQADWAARVSAHSLPALALPGRVRAAAAPLYGVDISNWDGPISDAWVQCCMAQGVRVFVPRLSLETAGKRDIAYQQLEVVQRNGGITPGYVWEYTTNNPYDDAQQLLDWYGDRGVVRYCVDAEETKYILDPAGNARWLDTFLHVLIDATGLTPIIYTAPWWWRPFMGNSHAFKDYPLWYANYDGVPTLDNPGPFGGWDGQLAAKQYDGGSWPFAICQRTVDRDVFDPALFEGSGGGPVTDEQLERMKRIARDDILGNVTSASARIGAALKRVQSPNARQELQTALENLDDGARPAAETLSRGDV